MKRNNTTRLVFAALAGLPLATVFTMGCSTTNKTVAPSSEASAFDRADLNHDGKLSLDELNIYIVNQVFDSRDANHDGKMTEQEWTGGDSQRLADFKKRDADGDGVVTKEEAIAYGRKHGLARKIMQEADKNHDGYLDRAEIQAYYASREGPPN
jgi:hypothetical protein